MKKYIVVMFICLTAFLIGAEEAKTLVEKTVPVAAPQVEAPSFITQNLDSLIKIVYSILGLLLSWWAAYRSYKHYGNETVREAIEALEAGIAHSEEDYVEWAKRAKADGKLTKEERAEAMRIARDKALSIAKGPALNLLKTKGSDILNAWIKKILERRKDGNNTAAPGATS